MRKIVAGLAITLDGVVDSPSGNWMRFDDELTAIITAGIAEADAILLGRRTYLEFAAMWPRLGGDVPMADFMNGSPKYVASRTLGPGDVKGWAGSELITGDLYAALDDLRDRPGKNIQVPGSPRLVRRLLADGYLDELALGIHPIVLGTGARLFDEQSGRGDLELLDSRALSSGVIYATYRPARAT